MLYEGPAAAVRSAISDTAARYIANGRRVGILTVNEDAAHYTQLGARIIALGEQHDHAAIGRVLFGALRALDGQGVDVILAPLLDSEGWARRSVTGCCAPPRARCSTSASRPRTKRNPNTSQSGESVVTPLVLTWDDESQTTSGLTYSATIRGRSSMTQSRA